jgi:lysozyme
MMDTSELERSIRAHEGYEQFSYADSMGFATIGIGRCTDRRRGKGISEEEAYYLLRNDIADCDKELLPYAWYKIQDDVRKCALIELCFNLGVHGLLEFRNMIAALLAKDYATAANELMDSAWVRQVGRTRSEDLAHRIEYGSYQTAS